MTTIPLRRGHGVPPSSHARPHAALRVALLTLGGLMSIIVILAGAGVVYERIAEDSDAQRYPPPGALVDIGGRSLHVNCTGSGSPTVLLEAGGGGTSLDWSLVQPVLAASTRICAYDRAGSGWSDAGPMPRSPRTIVDDLDALLRIGKISGPYVVVSHSDSGLSALLFAIEHRDATAGVVFVDARHPSSLSVAERKNQLDQAQMLPAITTIVGRSGIGRLFGAALFPQIYPEGRFLSPATRELMLMQASRPAYVDQVISSIASATANDFEITAAHAASLGSIPEVVLTTEEYLARYPGWRAGQEELATLSTDAVHRYVGPASEHYVAWQHPEIVIAAVTQVVDSVRTGRRLDRSRAI